MRILFVVCGEGLGHASRCVHLGHYMQQHGHSVHFVAYGKSYDFLNEHGCDNLHRGQREVCLEGENGFFSLEKTLWCSKWIGFNMVVSALRIWSLVHTLHIDFVVCDTMYGGLLGARFHNVPVVFITNQNRFAGPGGKTNTIWKILNFLIRRYVRLAHQIIVPDYPPPDTVSEYNIVVPRWDKLKYHFTGPFLEVNPSRYTYSRSTVFTSFGGEPYKLPLYQLLRTIADQRKDLFFDVFYTGTTLPESSDNFASHGYVPNLYEHLANAKIAIVHGGLTTLHETLLFEKPVLIIVDPDHPEQQNNAKKIIDMGAGTSVDGRGITLAILEQKITETLALKPKSFCSQHACINGRENACRIIEAVAEGRIKIPHPPTIFE